MRQLLIGDCHFGRHSNSTVWLEYQLTFFNTEVKDTIKNENIDRIIFLGDIFEVRYSTNTLIGCAVKNLIRDLLENFPTKEFVVIAGNHDFYTPQEEYHDYNTYEMLFGKEFMSKYNNLHILTYSEYYDNSGNLYLPWYHSENFDTFKNMISIYKNRGLKNIFLHSDLEHWDESMKTLTNGIDVWSGHIHYSWDNGKNLHIVGACCSFDFSDVNQKKYLYIIEDNRLVKRVENTVTPKFKSFYNEDIFTLQKEDFVNSYIELYIFNSNANKARYIERIKELNTSYAEFNIRKHIIDDSMGEDFTLAYFNTNIDNYISQNIPDYLSQKYNVIKDRLSNN